MKTKLILSLAAVAMFASAGAFASPANWPPVAPNVTPRALVSHAQPKCDTMLIATGGKYGGLQSVSCKQYAKVRPADCRIACARK